MDQHAIASQRMYNQHIGQLQFTKPEDVVKHMVAMQAQDYAGAKWAIGLRMENAKEPAIEQVIADGNLLRTHLLRPTWHFVSPDDIRWILALSAPRVNALNTGMYKKYELNSFVFNKSNDVFVKILGGDKHLNRAQITEALQQAGIATDDLRLTLLLMHAELDAIICSGAKEGKQFTYALLDERAPSTPTLTNEEAMTKLADGYFKSRGPATIHDFANWAGITITEANIGLNNVKEKLVSEVIQGKTYWTRDNGSTLASASKAYLLPAYDEFAIAYKHRDAMVNPKYLKQARSVIFDPVIVVDNQVVGNWKRTIKTDTVNISYNLFGKLNKVQIKAIEQAEKRYRKFLF